MELKEVSRKLVQERDSTFEAFEALETILYDDDPKKILSK